MTFADFCEANQLDADKFSMLIYRMSNEAEREFEAWATKQKYPSRQKFWRKQFDLLIKRSIRRATANAKKRGA